MDGEFSYGHMRSEGRFGEDRDFNLGHQWVFEGNRSRTLEDGLGVAEPSAMSRSFEIIDWAMVVVVTVLAVFVLLTWWKNEDRPPDRRRRRKG